LYHRDVLKALLFQMIAAIMNHRSLRLDGAEPLYDFINKDIETNRELYLASWISPDWNIYRHM
jgi:hypothetical protein